jgi:hypothetical protein
MTDRVEAFLCTYTEHLSADKAFLCLYTAFSQLEGSILLLNS